MTRIVFYILLLSPVYAVDLPQQEVCMDKSGWVYVITRGLSTLVTYPDGGWYFYDATKKFYQQLDVFRMPGMNNPADGDIWEISGTYTFMAKQ